MKVLVFSDSHGTITYMQQAIRSEEPDVVLHLGDVMRDARALQGRTLSRRSWSSPSRATRS